MAILTVLLGHFVPGVPEAGGLGVELFFVLSGLLMAKILIEERFPLQEFFIRRFSRIYPALFVFATIVFLISMLARFLGKSFNSLVGPLDYVSAVTIWINYKIAYIGEAGALNHVWSLSVEEHCYIILAVLAALFQRSRRVVIAVLVIAIAALINGYVRSRGVADPEHTVFWRTDVRLAPVFISFSIYLLTARWQRALGAVAVPAFVLGCALPFLAIDPAAQQAGTAILLALAVNGLASAPQPVRTALAFAPLQAVGFISYSLYLWQQPLYTLHERVTPLVLVPTAFVIAYLSYRFVEGPARKYINARWGTGHGSPKAFIHSVPET